MVMKTDTGLPGVSVRGGGVVTIKFLCGDATVLYLDCGCDDKNLYMR